MALYYVAGAGDDRNTGLSPQTAFRSIQAAANLTQPGDTVYVMDGSYTQANSFDNIVTVTRSGLPNAWITYQAYPGHRPKLQSHNWHGFSIQGADYIKIDGFELEGNNANVTLEQAIAQQKDLNNPLTSGNGIGITSARLDPTDRSHHIIIRNNIIHDFGGGGIYSIQADYVTVEQNTVYNNAWYAPYGCSGISNYQNWNSDESTATKMVIRNNIVYGNQNLIPFFVMGRVTDGNGIIVDDSRNVQDGSKLGAYLGRTLIANNLTYHNGGRGIHIYKSEHVDVFNNTSYQNSQHPAIRDGEITAILASDVQVLNNMLSVTSGQAANNTSGSSGVVYDYNRVYGSTRLFNAGSHNLIVQTPLAIDATVSLAASLGWTAIDRNVSLKTKGRGAGYVELGAVEFAEGLVSSTQSRSVNSVYTRWMRGTREADILLGGEGKDTLCGDAGDDLLRGGLGNDRLVGGDGSDRIAGEAGSDWLLGGTGRDCFMLTIRQGKDQIADFQVGQDRIQLDSSLGNAPLTYTRVGQSTLIRSGQDALALVMGILPPQVMASVTSK